MFKLIDKKIIKILRWIFLLILALWSVHEILVIFAYARSQGSDKQVHWQSLAIVFATPQHKILYSCVCYWAYLISTKILYAGAVDNINVIINLKALVTDNVYNIHSKICLSLFDLILYVPFFSYVPQPLNLKSSYPPPLSHHTHPGADPGFLEGVIMITV